ncbi:MAG: ribosome-binding factor A [Deltaproteobacteria bacterium GWA2_38_16]|nr:MAG: ribosome-binding factor A [Deltaproteobacteria bacterium GWA2_38_16]OGQ03290.1 MAG: ribosome-binding factor A [Deltaproteobacteria bacterium RIFCSPHIGHO2_02_FULL_38_15]OGQ34632.1 MAG: ribosome-binding factor A [Deltaproteobacteria bacterium RIFCSPLOWO2_01_FULL_38_9]OGQ62452.1 MAG: ribosome-binding factor A [Deltaproteobacteria bacterium RIFCSPLOWO2_12_FULL_38_8]
MTEGRRTKRASEQIRDVIAHLVIKGFKDPRVNGFITVTKVEMTPDLKLARVFVSILGEKEKRLKVLKGLQNASGFIKSNIAKALKLRFTPDLEFGLDDSLDYVEKIDRLLKEANGYE